MLISRTTSVSVKRFYKERYSFKLMSSSPALLSYSSKKKKKIHSPEIPTTFCSLCLDLHSCAQLLAPVLLSLAISWPEPELEASLGEVAMTGLFAHSSLPQDFGGREVSDPNCNPLCTNPQAKSSSGQTQKLLTHR